MGPAQIQQAIEHADGLRGSASNERDPSNAPIGPHHGIRLPGSVGPARRLGRMSRRFGKIPEFGQTCREIAAGKSRRKNRKPEKVERSFVQCLDDFP